MKDGLGLAVEAADKEDREHPVPPQEVGLPPLPPLLRTSHRHSEPSNKPSGQGEGRAPPGAATGGRGGGGGPSRGERRQGRAGRDATRRDGPGRARLGGRPPPLTVVRHHRLALVQLLRGSQMVLDALELRRQRGKHRGRHHAGGDAKRQQRTADNGSRSRAWRRPLPLPARDVGARARWAGCRRWRCAREERPLVSGRSGARSRRSRAAPGRLARPPVCPRGRTASRVPCVAR